MGLLSRLSEDVKAKLNELLDKTEDPEDPSESLDYACNKFWERIRRLETTLLREATDLKEELTWLDDFARRMDETGQKEMASKARNRKQNLISEIPAWLDFLLEPSNDNR